MTQPPASSTLGLIAAVILALATPAAQARPAQDAAPPEQPAWKDQVISPEDLAPLPPDEDADFVADGLPRSLRAELLVSRSERGSQSFLETGLSVGGFRETQDFGTFSLDATLQRSERDGDGEAELGGKATLWQRGFHASGDWLANNGLGVLNTPSTELLRQQYRFFLPSVPFAGVGTEWSRGRGDAEVAGAIGRAGVFDGARVVGFELADGNVGTAAGQWRWNPRWRSALAVLATDGQILPDDQGGTFFQGSKTQALHAATGWESGRNAVNVNLQSSAGDLGSAWGAWLDGRHGRGRYTHHFGLFRLEPGLAWGAQPINNDNQGAYYRVGYQHARWSWNAGFDRISSISGDSFNGSYGTAFMRYQATSTLAYGGNVAVRENGSRRDSSSQLFLDRTNRWGQGRAQLDLARSDGGSDDSWQFTLDQSLAMRQGRRLTVSGSYGELAYGGRPASASLSLSAYGGLDLSERVSLDGTASWTRGDGPDAFRGADLNLNLAWRMASRWWLVATLYENRGSRRSPFVIDPLATAQPYVDLPRDRSLFLSLRYERQAGTTPGVLGGSPGSATGSIRGSVFLDENSDGARAATEQPAANVTVILDGRYAVRTDSQGSFEFPRVAVGSHTVEVVPDNLPLPWFLDGPDDRRVVDVQVRDSVQVDIGARRQR